jgi:hypothetical protein
LCPEKNTDNHNPAVKQAYFLKGKLKKTIAQQAVVAEPICARERIRKTANSGEAVVSH